MSSSDPVILQIEAEENRVLIGYDLKTMTHRFGEFIELP
jgi:hypothetical protein